MTISKAANWVPVAELAAFDLVGGLRRPPRKSLIFSKTAKSLSLAGVAVFGRRRRNRPRGQEKMRPPAGSTPGRAAWLSLM